MLGSFKNEKTLFPYGTLGSQTAVKSFCHSYQILKNTHISHWNFNIQFHTLMLVVAFNLVFYI